MFKLKKAKSFVSFWLLFVLFATLLSGCGIQQDKAVVGNKPAKTRTIVDHAGRTLTIPSQINKIFSTSPVGSIMVYTLSPDKLVGWNYDLRPAERSYILPKYQALPNLGGWYAKSTCNVEELLKIHPDVLINMGTVDETAISQAEQIQQQLNIPVIIVNGELTKLDQAYELVGDLLGEKSRSAELAAYCRQTVGEVAKTTAQIPADQRVKVYYAEGPKGLQTDPKGSPHTEVLDLVGAVNVADVPMKGGMGMAEVSLEQVLAWNPDVIITWHEDQGGTYKNILTDPKWQDIKAVKNHRVYEIPDAPFSWFDRPPSVNRVIGVKWLANLLYPETIKLDPAAEVKYFYSRFYHLNLSDQEVEKLLTKSGGKVK